MHEGRHGRCSNIRHRPCTVCKRTNSALVCCTLHAADAGAALRVSDAPRLRRIDHCCPTGASIIARPRRLPRHQRAVMHDCRRSRMPQPHARLMKRVRPVLQACHAPVVKEPQCPLSLGWPSSCSMSVWAFSSSTPLMFTAPKPSATAGAAPLPTAW